jgi:lactococcin 972 family bacteriocin
MRYKKTLSALAVAGMLAIAPAAAATASVMPKAAVATGSNTTQPGGGLWQYGTTSQTVFSYYNHSSKNHTATACDGSLFKTCRQVAAIKGQWARSTTQKTWTGGNTAFWNTL